MKPAAPQRWQVLQAPRSCRSSRGSNLHYVPVLADRARRAARLRPARKLLARDAAHGQDVSIIREIGPFCTASISQATLRRTETTELTVKTKLARHTSDSLHSLLARLPFTHQPAIIPFR